MKRFPRWLILLILAASAAGGWVYVNRETGEAEAEPRATANGRIEATEVDIAAKLPGRIEEITVDEGDMVEAGQVVARMDTDVLRARLHEAQAQLTRARQQKSVRAALVEQRQSECNLADKDLARAQRLFEQDAVSEEALDKARTAQETARYACAAARAQLVESDSAIEAAEAAVDRVRAEIRDTVLQAPRSGQVLYRLAEPGEVVGAGGKLLTLIDLDDIEMTVYLPTEHAGRVKIGAPARLVLDAFPERPVKARVAFVAREAQFTPKQVETRAERQKLMFRVKVRALENPDGLLKPGMPGVAEIELTQPEPADDG